MWNLVVAVTTRDGKTDHSVKVPMQVLELVGGVKEESLHCSNFFLPWSSAGHEGA